MGVRNAFRNNVRTFSIVLILSLSIGLALALLIARSSVVTKINDVKTSLGNTVAISPAGTRGDQGGGEPLTTAQIEKVSKLPHVTGVSSALTDTMSTSETDLKAALQSGSLGNRRNRNNGNGNGNSSRSSNQAALPINITGADSLLSSAVYGGDEVEYKSGEAFEDGSSDLVAVVGEDLAEKNSLKVGSTFTAFLKTFKVVGIYDADSRFANAGLVVPLKALQSASSRANNVTSATARVDSIDNMASVTEAVKSTLGTAADVTSSEAVAKAALEPLEGVKSVSTISLIGALGASAVIILLTMVMIVRERRREIGVFKAIGASDFTIMVQFACEAVTLTMIGLVAGAVIGMTMASPITNTLVTSSNSTADGGSGNGNGGGGGGNGNGNNSSRRETRDGLRALGNNSLGSIRQVQSSVGISTILLGVLLAFVVAIVGSAVPSYLISKIRPAEVMRAE